MAVPLGDALCQPRWAVAPSCGPNPNPGIAVRAFADVAKVRNQLTLGVEEALVG